MIASQRARRRNRALLAAGAEVVEVWLPRCPSPFIVDVFRPKLPQQPPTFEGILFENGRPANTFTAADLELLFRELKSKYPVFQKARRLPRRDLHV